MLKFDSVAAAEVVRGGPNMKLMLAAAGLSFHNPFEVDLFRNGERIDCKAGVNGIVDAGLNALLDIMFHGSTQITTWYLGLIDNSGYSALANADTMASHAGWNEFTTYSETDRVTWTEGAASSRAMTNSSPVVFNITGTGTVKGIFVASNNTKSGTTGTLWATALFSGNVAVQNGDQLKVTYTISG